MASSASREVFRFLGPAAWLVSPAADSLKARPTPLQRHGFATPTAKPRIRLGSIAPNFTTKPTHGDIDFHSFINNSWTILFSHSADFTLTYTTELRAFTKLKDDLRNAMSR
jgi:hypothetical protein